MKTLKYGSVPVEEAEVIIRLDKQDRMAHVNSTWAEWSRKFERRHGTPARYTERNGVVVSAFWTLPLAAISIRKPRQPKTAHPSAVRPRKVALSGKTPVAPTLGATRLDVIGTTGCKVTVQSR